MLARQGNRAMIKVLDFGLAKIKSERETDSGLTHEGQMLGTPDFVAPEQISDARTADIRADIYSLGCTLVLPLHRRPPFQGTSLYDILQAHHSMEAMPLNLARPDVPVELAALVAKMMAKEPERRFREPKEVAQALIPFFKRPALPADHSAQKVSRDNLSSGTAPVPGVVQSPVERASKQRQPAGRAMKAAERRIDEAPWATLLELEDTAGSTARSPVVAKPRRSNPPWLRTAVAAGILLGLAIALGVIIKLHQTDGGVLIVDVSEPGAEITVDKQQVTVTWDADRKRAEIKALPGEHTVEVTRDGFTARGINVAVADGGRQIVKAVLERADQNIAQVACARCSCCASGFYACAAGPTREQHQVPRPCLVGFLGDEWKRADCQTHRVPFGGGIDQGYQPGRLHIRGGNPAARRPGKHRASLRRRRVQDLWIQSERRPGSRVSEKLEERRARAWSSSQEVAPRRP